MQKRDRRGPAEIRGDCGECARSFGVARLVFSEARDVHKAIDGASATQALDLAAPVGGGNAVGRCVKQHGAGNQDCAGLFETGCDFVDMFVVAGEYQPWKAVAPAYAAGVAEFVAEVLEAGVAYLRPGGQWFIAGLAKNESCGDAVRTDRQGDEMSHDDDRQCEAGPQDRRDAHLFGGQVEQFPFRPDQRG
ncbi:hypothetical protein [Paraburkholderia sp. 2C]